MVAAGWVGSSGRRSAFSGRFDHISGGCQDRGVGGASAAAFWCAERGAIRGDVARGDRATGVFSLLAPSSEFAELFVFA